MNRGTHNPDNERPPRSINRITRIYTSLGLYGSTYFFARGSERWHRWLMSHPTLSVYILAFRDKRGLTRAQKWRVAGLVSLTLIVTGVFAPFYGKELAAFIWVTSLLFLYFTPTAETNLLRKQTVDPGQRRG
ncbi:MAG TPA: YbaN family protein [Blastocatellia bacterium]|nr:YbaN family protein [Blastocatellia bacterium]